jgi:hypothetical protein
VAAGAEAIPGIDQAAGQGEDHHDEQGAEDDLVDLHQADRQLLADEDIDRRAEHRSPQRADAAKVDRQHRVEGPARGKGQLGVLVLQELQLADSVQDLRHRGGTCKLVGDRDHLRPFVEGPLSGYGFRWKEAKGRRHGCYWTDHGKLSLPKQGRPAGRGDQGT